MAIILRLENNKATFSRTGYDDVSVEINYDYANLFTKLQQAGATIGQSSTGCEDWTIEAVDWTEVTVESFTENGVDYTGDTNVEGNWSVVIAGRDTPIINPTFALSCPNVFEQSFRFFTPELNQHVYVSSQNETVNFVNILGGAEVDYSFSFNGQPDLNFGQVQGLSLSSGDTLTIKNNSTAFQDATIKAEFTRGVAIVSPFSTVNNFADNTTTFGHLDNDFALGLNKKVTINSITPSSTANLFYAIRTSDYLTEDYTNFPHNNLVDLQADIDALIEGTAYTIHIFASWDTTTGGSVTVTATYQDTGLTQEFQVANDFESHPEFREIDKGLFFDGVTDYLEIDNFLGLPVSDRLDADTPFTYSISFTQKVKSFVFGNLFVVSNPYGGPTSDIDKGIQISVFVNSIRLIFISDTGGGTLKTPDDGLVYYLVTPTKFNGNVIITYDGLKNPDSVNAYINGRKINIPRVFNTLTTDAYKMHDYPYLFARYPGSNTVFDTGIVSELLLSKYTPTSAEAWQMFKRNTNNISNYGTHYPANVLANRDIHYSFDAGQYSGLFVTDLTGNTTPEIKGQTTPDVVDFYY